MSSRKPDMELSLYRWITTRLPRFRGPGVIGNELSKLYRRKPREPVCTEVLGIKMELDPHECVDSTLLFMPQLYDHQEVRYMREHLRLGDVFVDVGANIGFYSFIAAKLVGETGQVIAIEAVPGHAPCVGMQYKPQRCNEHPVGERRGI